MTPAAPMRWAAVRLFSICALGCGLGCVVQGDAGALTADGTRGEAGSAATDTTTRGEDDDDDDDRGTTTDGAKLDVPDPDVGTMECASVGQTTTIEERPSDIVIAVDRDMDPVDMDALFLNFSQLIADDGIEDVRVVMIAGYPPDGVCIDAPPLGIGQCPTNDHNPPLYRRFDEVLDAPSLLTQLLDTYEDWGGVLRPMARTHVFVLASADADLDIDTFDSDFSALDPTLSGYRFHAIAPDQDNTGGDCGGVREGAPWAAAPGYQSLVATTGGVFSDACNYNVGELFDALLDRIQEVALACEYDIPAAPDGFVFDQEEVNVDYDDGAGLETIGFAASVDACAGVADGWYYDDALAPQQIVMCPQTCARFEQAAQASIEIRFGCTTIPAG